MPARTSTGLSLVLVNRFLEYFNGGWIEVHTGSKPESSDAAPTGTLLGYVTRGGAPMQNDPQTSGLTFDAVSTKGDIKDTGDWTLVVSAEGTAGWWRMRWSATDNGAVSDVIPRLDGEVGDTLLLDNTNITLAQSPIGATFNLTFG